MGFDAHGMAIYAPQSTTSTPTPPMPPVPQFVPGAGQVGGFSTEDAHVSPAVLQAKAAAAPAPVPPAATAPPKLADAAQSHVTMAFGERLGSKVLSAQSSRGYYGCALQYGDLVLRLNGSIIWRAGTVNAVDLVADKWGNLALVDAGGVTLWETNTGQRNTPGGPVIKDGNPRAGGPEVFVSGTVGALCVGQRAQATTVNARGESVPSPSDVLISYWDSVHGLSDYNHPTIIDDIALGIAIALPVVVAVAATAGAAAAAAPEVAGGAGTAAGVGTAGAGAAVAGGGAVAAGGLSLGGVVATVGTVLGGAAGVVGTVAKVGGLFGGSGGGTTPTTAPVSGEAARYETFREWLKRTTGV